MCLHWQECESDECDESDESDGEELAAVAAPAALPAVEGVEPDDDPDTNTFEVALGEAVERAEEIFQCNEVPDKICHCTCQLWNDNRCIEQFSAAECDDIRYMIHSKLSTHFISCQLQV